MLQDSDCLGCQKWKTHIQNFTADVFGDIYLFYDEYELN